MLPLAKAAVFAGVLLGAMYLLWRGGASQWQALPNGGDIRVFAITKGPIHAVKIPGPMLTMQQVRTAIRMRSLSPLKGPPLRNDKILSRWPDLRVWFETQGNPMPPKPRDPTMILSDGRRISSRSGGEGFDGTTQYYYSSFRYIPYREKTIRVVCQVGDKTVELTHKNPFYRKDLPVWTSSPLPQTRSNGDLELRLQKLVSAKPTFPPPRPGDPNWIAKPTWSMTKGGENADAWFHVRTGFEDPAGQRLSEYDLAGEPVWKVCADLSRTNSYPFRDDEVSWLGVVTPEAPAEQTYRLLPIKDGGSPLKLAGIFGRGQYSIREDDSIPGGLAISVQPPPETPPPRHRKIGTDFQTKTIELTLDQAGVVFIGDAFLVLRDSCGGPKELDEDWSHGGFTHIELYHLPKAPIRVGTANPGSWKFEFLVDAPKPPQP